MSRVTQPQPHRPRRSGRWSPPLWGCYEYQTSGSEHDSECDTCSGSDDDSGSEAEERERDHSESGSDSESGSEQEHDEDRAQRLKEKRKGKQPESSIRRKQHREPVYRPILTIRRSEGFVWNQVGGPFMITLP
jgi:hypothetical protein